MTDMNFPDIVKDHEDDVYAWQADHPSKRPPDSYSRESALIELVREIEPVKCQFTRCHTELHPECDNDTYLEYETVDTGLSKGICAYGYQIQIGTKYWWIPKGLAKALLDRLGEK